jgi:membrane-associated phospholipid phosphatase
VFEQDFDFMPYQVTTGHATLYWDTRWNGVQASLSYGQYLAGDRGSTVDISRVFRNGIRVGAFASITNATKEQFGEGSFNKGVYVSLPFDTILLASSPLVGNFTWTPLTRDGGAKLGRRYPLMDLTDSRGKLHTEFAPASDMRIDPDITPGPEQALRDVGRTVTSLYPAFSERSLWSGVLLSSGIVLASSVFDKAGDSWARSHPAGKWKTLASAANAIPLAMGMGAGMLLTGIAGDHPSDTAWTAFKSAGLALGVQYAGKIAVGRARPELDKGPRNFSREQNGGTNSSFPSGHMTAAFALATPFAKRYGADWLYGLAALTGYGRIQGRKHWVSDTVAGGFLGYGIATLVEEADRRDRLSVGVGLGEERSIYMQWRF